MKKAELLNSKISHKEGLTYDDILLLPGYTQFKREEVDLTTILHPKLILKLPVISSPMDTVTEIGMAEAMARSGGMGIIHRNLPVDTQKEMIHQLKQKTVLKNDENFTALDQKKRLLVGAAVGTGKDLEQRVNALVQAQADCIVIDSGHGYTKFVIDAIRYIKSKYQGMIIMAGNVATFEGAKALIDNGADILRVGMGPGSICTTRIITGMGVPQLTAVMEAVKAVNGSQVTVVADGGIRQMGDIAKAIGLGADAVMLGSLLARFDESPGNIVEIQGKKYKSYRGMGSITAMKKGGAERYGQSRDTDIKRMVSEGVEGLVEYNGSVSDYLFQINGSLRSSFYYIGAKNMVEFFDKSRFIKISRAGLTESHPHSVVITDTGTNYHL